MNRSVLAILLASTLLAACRPAATATPEPRTLTVFAAASLTDAFSEIARQFEADHPGVALTVNFAGSQTLSVQLLQGAAADVFASANAVEMDKLVDAGLVLPDGPQVFLTNSLVVLLPPGNPAGVQTLQDLARPGLKLVLADEAVPAGKYARQVLEVLSRGPSFGMDFDDRVLANVVSNEIDVKQVVAKVQLGEADAGIVYVSDAVAVPDLETIEIPAAYNVIASYPIALLEHAPQAGLGAEFIACVFSPDGQAVLEKWGFTPVSP